MIQAVTAIAAFTLGFSFGLLTFKRSTHWCPRCASTLRCLRCEDHPTYMEALRSVRLSRRTSRGGIP